MTWKPHVTVAAITEKDGKFLMVEEKKDDQMVINQPAGHLEPNETLIEAVIRETLEETAWRFQPDYLIGVYQWQNTENTSFLRFAFAGNCDAYDSSRALDPDIHQAIWMDINAIQSDPTRLRSPLVLKCLTDYINGHHYPLTLLSSIKL